MPSVPCFHVPKVFEEEWQPFEQLPEELIVGVLSFLEAKDLVTVGKVSKKFYRLSDLDRLWEALCPQSEFDGINESGSITKDYNASWKHYFAARIHIPKEIKIVVLGASSVGKTACIIKYVQGVFVETNDAILEDQCIRTVTFGGKSCRIEFIDASGTDRYLAIRDLYMRKGHGFVAVFSITSEASFRDVTFYMDKVTQIKEEEARLIPFILVGTKADLEEKRLVSQERAKELATKYSCPYIEISAKNNTNVEKVFHECCYLYIQRLQAQRENKIRARMSMIGMNS